MTAEQYRDAVYQQGCEERSVYREAIDMMDELIEQLEEV